MTTRTSLEGMWFPLVVFGALSCLSAVVSWRLGGDVLGIYWLCAAPVGSVLTGLYYSREERRVGLEMPTWHWMVGVAVIVVGAFGTGALGAVLGADMVSAVGPLLFVSLGYVIFARIERSAPLAVIAVALAVFTIAMAASGTEPNTVASVLAAVYGGSFVVTGIVLQRQRSTLA